MPDCTICGAKDAPSLGDGRIIEGGFGQFDMTRLVCLDRDAGQEGAICDSCVGNLLADGKAETFEEPGMFEAGRRPSQAAYQALFEAGAECIRAMFHAMNGPRVYQRRPLGDAGKRTITTLRSKLCGDDTFSETAHAEHRRPGDLALRAGECHAICAISLGYGEEDPGFQEAARVWAEKRHGIDEMIERNRQTFLGPMS